MDLKKWQSEMEASLIRFSQLLANTPAFETASLPEGYEDELRADPDYAARIESDIEVAEHVIALATAARVTLVVLLEISKRTKQ